MPGLLWLIAALAAMIVPLTALAHVTLALVAAICALVLAQPTRIRIVSALAMLPIAFASAPTWSFIAAGGLLAVAVARPRVAPARGGLEAIQHRLEWCRRRDEASHLLWVHAPGIDRETATTALSAFRVTDAAALLHETDGGEEIVAMVDDANFEPTGLERRLRVHLGEEAGFGWASFPQDGLTLDALFSHARGAAVSATAPGSAPRATQLPRQIRRLGSRHASGVPARSSNQG